MSVKITPTAEVQEFLRIASGLNEDGGNPRAKEIIHRLLTDLCVAIEDLNITPDELWAGVGYLNSLGAAGEAGLLTAGSGLEHFLDLRMDALDAQHGIEQGTPRTIEGPLYVAGAPLVDGFAKLDDGSDKDGRTLIMHGKVVDANGQPLANAIVDVWHANTKGLYSYFDKSQRDYNMRRRIRTGADGSYKFESIVPHGYGCPPEGPTQAYLDQLGRHGQRPAHIHFFITADGHRRLTTQINIAGDEYLHDDFAYATRDDLIPELHERTDEASMKAHQQSGPFVEIDFDFVLIPLTGTENDADVERARAVPA